MSEKSPKPVVEATQVSTENIESPDLQNQHNTLRTFEEGVELISKSVNLGPVIGTYWSADNLNKRRGYKGYGWQNFYDNYYEGDRIEDLARAEAGDYGSVVEDDKEVITLEPMVRFVAKDTDRTRPASRLVTKQVKGRFGKIRNITVQESYEEPIYEYAENPINYTHKKDSKYYGQQAVALRYYIGSGHVKVILPETLAESILEEVKGDPRLARYIMACSLAKSVGETTDQALERMASVGSMHDGTPSIKDWHSLGLIIKNVQGKVLESVDYQ